MLKLEKPIRWKSIEINMGQSLQDYPESPFQSIQTQAKLTRRSSMIMK